MKYLLRQSTIPKYAGIATAVLFVVLGLFLLVPRVHAADEISGRLVTIHDRGIQTTIVTEGETIKNALEDAGISLDAHDAVQPSVDEKLVAKEYNVNIYRARPVIVIDGPTRQKVVTPYQVAERIVEDAGIVLHPEDKTILKRTNNIVADGAGLQLTIDRATLVTLTLFGSKTEIRTQGDTVAGMLKEKGIELGDNDRASVALSTPISTGMEITVWREGKQTVTVQEPVAFEVEQIRNADREIGFKEVQTPGQDGQRNATYEIEIRDGVEVQRTEIASIVTTQPVKQVEVIGAKPKSLPYTGGGTKTEWLAASNIPAESWGYADFMVNKESGWNPNAVNRSSGACGLAQALPCSKLGPNWNDPVVALNWMNSYVNGRYYDGSPYARGLCSGMSDRWRCAYTFWQANKWY